ncbi:L-rhamnose mutarotase [Nocardioides marmorisolisilvae]|uniref:L-rhamnose mutarotase n=1 Tax=Nocardioides marmorisolisilvae TaxID=1542737 RepID=UPI0016077391|nr:L-rhamnose mutarotase [Nocardioides marmorisolisilvae]
MGSPLLARRPEPGSSAVEVTVQRARLRPGAGARYSEVHSRIPARIEAALRSCGVIRWQIWRDGDDSLFHLIETADGFDVMLERMRLLGPIDPEWDQLIDALVDSADDSFATLEHVWTMTPEGQHGGEDGLAVPSSDRADISPRPTSS